jgi:hypothetical protein
MESPRLQFFVRKPALWRAEGPDGSLIEARTWRDMRAQVAATVQTKYGAQMRFALLLGRRESFSATLREREG